MPSTDLVLDVSICGIDHNYGVLGGTVTATGGGEFLIASGFVDAGVWYADWYAKPAEAPVVTPVVAPEVGLWFGHDTPESVGICTGVRLGVGICWRKAGRYVALDYRWLTLHDVSGDERAKAQAIALRYLW